MQIDHIILTKEFLFDLCLLAKILIFVFLGANQFQTVAVKDGLSFKINILQIHLYSIATKYLWNNALVEYIDNWI